MFLISKNKFNFKKAILALVIVSQLSFVESVQPFNSPIIMFSFFKSKAKRNAIYPEAIYRIVEKSHRATVRLADNKYNTCTDEEAFRFIRNVRSFYGKEWNDCDDTAFMAKAEAIKAQRKEQVPLAFGIVWTSTHAFNWYINESYQLKFIDNDGSIIESPRDINLFVG